LNGVYSACLMAGFSPWCLYVKFLNSLIILINELLACCRYQQLEILRDIHRLVMVHTGPNEHSVWTMESKLVRTHSTSFGAHSVVVCTMETPGSHYFAPFKAVFWLCRPTHFHSYDITGHSPYIISETSALVHTVETTNVKSF